MDKLKPALLVFVLLIVLGLVCSIGGSGLLNNTSHVMVAQANLEAWKTTRYMAGTIDRQSTSLVVAMIVMAVALLAIITFSGIMVVRVGRTRSESSPRFGQGTPAPKFLSLGPDAPERIRRMTPGQRRALLGQLYTIVDYLEQEQGVGQKRLPVYEKKESLIDWG